MIVLTFALFVLCAFGCAIDVLLLVRATTIEAESRSGELDVGDPDDLLPPPLAVWPAPPRTHSPSRSS